MKPSPFLVVCVAVVGFAAAGIVVHARQADAKVAAAAGKRANAVPVLTSFVSKSGGANVGNLLAGVLK